MRRATALLRQGAHPHRHLLQGSVAVVGATIIVAVSGLLFWLVVARRFDATEVGRATALLSSVYFVSYLTNMGLRLAVGRYATDHSDLHRARFAAAALYTTSTAIVGSAIYLAVTRASAAEVLGPGGLVLFVVVAIGASLGPLTDVRQMALRRWWAVSLRAALVLVGRGVSVMILLILSPEKHQPVLLFLGAALPDALSGIIAATLAGWRGALHILRTRRSPELSEAFRYANVNYVSQLTVQAPLMATPVIVLLMVPPEQNASFYVAWGFFTVALLLPQGLTAALHVEGKKDGVSLGGQLRIALRVGLAASVAGSLASLVVGVLIPVVYGDDYRAAGRLLPWLVVASIPWTVVMIRLTAARIEQRAAATVAISLVFALTCLGPTAAFTAVFGIGGAALGWLVGTITTAIFGTLLLRRAARLRPSAEPSDTELAAEAADVAAAEAEIVGLG